MLMFKPLRFVPLCVVVLSAVSWSAPASPDVKATTRVTPQTGVAAAFDATLVSPLLLSPLLGEKKRLQVLNDLQKRAGVKLSLMPVPPRGDVPNSWMLAQYKTAKSERELWWLFGEHLLMSAFLRNSRFADDRANGLDIALIVTRQVVLFQKEGKLATDILQGWVLPFYSECEGEGQIAPSRVTVAKALLVALEAKRNDVRLDYAQRYGAISELIEARRLLISVTTDAGVADYSRWQMALLLERLGRFDEAIACIREVNPRGNHRGALKEIPRLEKERDEQQKAQAAVAAQLGEKTPQTPTQPPSETEIHAP